MTIPLPPVQGPAALYGKVARKFAPGLRSVKRRLLHAEHQAVRLMLWCRLYPRRQFARLLHVRFSGGSTIGGSVQGDDGLDGGQTYAAWIEGMASRLQRQEGLPA